jgi:hypothetical protein
MTLRYQASRRATQLAQWDTNTRVLQGYDPLLGANLSLLGLHATTSLVIVITKSGSSKQGGCPNKRHQFAVVICTVDGLARSSCSQWEHDGSTTANTDTPHNCLQAAASRPGHCKGNFGGGLLLSKTKKTYTRSRTLFAQ